VSEQRLRLLIAAAALLGLAIAGYLTYIHYADIHPFCVSGGQACEKVQASKQAKLAGVPVAVLGLIGYAGILLSAAIRGEAGRLAGALLALSGFGFSLYLTSQEIFSIHAICQWCVASAIVMTVLAGLTVGRVLAAEPVRTGA
jgi:uncharacterized membrane protein